MLFALIYTDKPGSLSLRQATRPAHLDYLRAREAAVQFGGPLLDPDGNPCGSLLIVEAADRAAAEAIAAGDPYVKAGLFESTVIRPIRQVARDGKLAG
ncbi:MAG: YciI family protein [Acetobacteraceae bacterium]|nr:YciI family protein [Acetobacteraceae bacterium]